MNVHPIHAGNPGFMTGGGNWTYLLPGPRPVLIDAGVGKPQHLEDIARLVAAGPGRVVVTHIHPDHADGAPAIAARFGATTFHKMPWPGRDATCDVAWQPLDDGDRIDTGEALLEVIHTPGHSPDHVAIWHADSRTAFTGDLLVRGGTVVIPASTGGNLVDYLQSLRRLRALEPARVLPAHGPPIEDPIALIDIYLRHRHEREVQVLAALRSGLCKVEKIAASLYPATTPALVTMTQETVLAHLVKLDHDGIVEHTTDGWSVNARDDGGLSPVVKLRDPARRG